MSVPATLAATVKAMRPMVPAKDFAISERFYLELGFTPRALAPKLVEMRLGVFAFILQDYYIREWADNFVVHLRVSDVQTWWDQIVRLDLAQRYQVKATPPRDEGWGLVANLGDPSGVLWRIAQHPASDLS